jgi:hypothetical protein
LGLVLLGWPETNSDEATMGLMALHIAQGRDFPLFFYGQSYTGSGEAWAAAGLFALSGPSLVALRLALVASYAAFVFAMWQLGRLLHGHRVALVTTLLLALGSTELLASQLRASGSRVELLLAGSLMAWLSAWLVLRGPRAEPWRQGVAAAGWGLAAGYGVWSDLLTVPWALLTGLLLAICWRPPQRRLAVGLLFAGLLVGGFPQVLHNARADWGRNDSVTVVLNQRGYQAGSRSPSLTDRVAGTVTVALPYATGGSALIHRERPGAWLTDPVPARIALGTWGVGLIVLLAGVAWRNLRDLRRTWRGPPHRPPAAPLARLGIVGSVALTVAVFATSPRAVYTPIASSRYLLGVLLAVPVLLGALAIPAGAKLRRQLSGLAIAVVVALLTLDTVGAYGQALVLRRSDPEQRALAGALLHRGITRVWTDYWTCNRLVFESRERIVCGSLGNDLALHDNRYAPYLQAVQADASAPYLFPASSPQAAALQRRGRRSESLPEGYVMFPDR